MSGPCQYSHNATGTCPAKGRGALACARQECPTENDNPPDGEWFEQYQGEPLRKGDLQ